MKKVLWSERVKKAPWFFTIEPYLRPQDKPVSSHPEAREPRIVPLVVTGLWQCPVPAKADAI